MVVLGVVLLLVGAALLVAEAHVPAGVLGATGAVLLAGGTALAIAGAGAGVALAIAAAAGAAACAALWITLAARKSLAVRRLKPAAGREALAGHLGVVRSWTGDDGQVLVDGALWRARRSLADENGALHTGDSVVVERVSGLTLAVRRAEEWEEPW